MRRVAALAACLALACAPARTLPRTVSLRLRGGVPDARVTIDDVLVGPLAVVAARGVALPRGPHRITVERAGYFPWDALVEATEAPLSLDVELAPIPE